MDRIRCVAPAHCCNAKEGARAGDNLRGARPAAGVFSVSAHRQVQIQLQSLPVVGRK